MFTVSLVIMGWRSKGFVLFVFTHYGPDVLKVFLYKTRANLMTPTKMCQQIYEKSIVSLLNDYNSVR